MTNTKTLRYGGGHHAVVTESIRNFGQSYFQNLSLCCTPVSFLSNDEELSTLPLHASAFYYRYKNRPFLISNWHVFSGRDWLTGQLVSQSTGYIPQNIGFRSLALSGDGRHVEFQRPGWRFRLDDKFTEFLREPPRIDGYPVDIWAMPLPEGFLPGPDPNRKIFSGSENFSCFINDLASEKIGTSTGDECFVIGYPLSNFEAAQLPVWKKGSIASEPLLGLGPYKAFLLDVASTSGMSGSPVVRFARGPNEYSHGMVRQSLSLRLVGVYGGRLLQQELERTNLGYTWFSSVIDQVIELADFQQFSELERVSG